MISPMQQEIRKFATQLLKNLGAKETDINQYVQFQNGHRNFDSNNEIEARHEIGLSLNGDGSKQLFITDDTTDSEQNISFAVTSALAGNIVYFLFIFDGPDIQLNDNSMEYEYFFNYVAEDSLPFEGFIKNKSDCEKYFNSIIEATGLEIYIMEE